MHLYCASLSVHLKSAVRQCFAGGGPHRHMPSTLRRTGTNKAALKGIRTPKLEKTAFVVFIVLVENNTGQLIDTSVQLKYVYVVLLGRSCLINENVIKERYDVY